MVIIPTWAAGVVLLINVTLTLTLLQWYQFGLALCWTHVNDCVSDQEIHWSQQRVIIGRRCYSSVSYNDVDVWIQYDVVKSHLLAQVVVCQTRFKCDWLVKQVELQSTLQGWTFKKIDFVIRLHHEDLKCDFDLHHLSVTCLKVFGLGNFMEKLNWYQLSVSLTIDWCIFTSPCTCSTTWQPMEHVHCRTQIRYTTGDNYNR